MLEIPDEVKLSIFKPGKRSVTIGGQRYFLPFPYVVLFTTPEIVLNRQIYVSKLVYACYCKEHPTLNSVAYFTTLGNIFNNYQVCTDRMGDIDPEVYFWASDFSSNRDWLGNCILQLMYPPQPIYRAAAAQWEEQKEFDFNKFPKSFGCVSTTSQVSTIISSIYARYNAYKQQFEAK